MSDMSLAPPDPSLYVRPPVMTLAGGITLCRVVADACPAAMPWFVKKGAVRLAEVAEAAHHAHNSRKKALAKEHDDDVRAIDKTADRSWSALRGRLEMYTLLPADAFPDAKRAEEILASLFGEMGLLFLTTRYPEQHAVADALLRRIDEESLADDIDRIAGKDFLANVRAQHATYGTFVAALFQREDALSQDLADHVRAMGQALVDYATKVLASIDRDHPSTILAAQVALRPIDVFRDSSQARPLKSAEPAETPESTPSAT